MNFEMHQTYSHYANAAYAWVSPFLNIQRHELSYACIISQRTAFFVPRYY